MSNKVNLDSIFQNEFKLFRSILRNKDIFYSFKGKVVCVLQEFFANVQYCQKYVRRRGSFSNF